MTRAWTRGCATLTDRNSLIFLMLCSANLHDRAIVEIWVEMLSWLSKTNPRFLAVLVGVSIVDPSCTVMLRSTDRFVEITRSSIFAKVEI